MSSFSVVQRRALPPVQVAYVYWWLRCGATGPGGWTGPNADSYIELTSLPRGSIDLFSAPLRFNEVRVLHGLLCSKDAGES